MPRRHLLSLPPKKVGKEQRRESVSPCRSPVIQPGLLNAKHDIPGRAFALGEKRVNPTDPEASFLRVRKARALRNPNRLPVTSLLSFLGDQERKCPPDMRATILNDRFKTAVSRVFSPGGAPFCAAPPEAHGSGTCAFPPVRSPRRYSPSPPPHTDWRICPCTPVS